MAAELHLHTPTISEARAERSSASRAALSDKYTINDGTVYMTGIQALVRLPMDQARRDRDRGLRIAGFISGYPGSPLGGYDLALHRNRPLLDQHDVVHTPGINEEIAATSVLGSQKLAVYRASKFDGVSGLWYGKCNGADRCVDVFKYGNYGGSDGNCSVVLLGGDDPGNKSSGLPSQTEYTYMAAGIPVLYPGSVQEVLDLGLHAIAMSRLTNCWIALKLVTDVCDGGATVEVGTTRSSIRTPTFVEDPAYRNFSIYDYYGQHAIEAERHLFSTRHEYVREYARTNQLDQIVIDSPRARIGIVSAGKTFGDTRQALQDMGMDDRALGEFGVRLLQLGLTYPLDPEIVRRFAKGLREVIVVEEKRPFIETQLRDVLYGMSDAPRIVGKHDEEGKQLFPVHGEMEADSITQALGPQLNKHGTSPSVQARVAYVERVNERATKPTKVFPLRLPTYCSGCPHSTGATLGEGQEALGGIGCHSIAVFATQPERQYLYNVQMGGEGAPWLGTAPFLTKNHVFQNVGDGTYSHSASLNIRACVAAGVNITFKILYNQAVAMTGGQEVAGIPSVPALTRALEAEGVKRTIVVGDHPGKHKGQPGFAKNVSLYGRERYAAAHDELEKVAGVTALIYDQECAAEERRKRRRGLVPQADRFVVINPEVCEGCGHCGEVSNCVSLHPIETEFGDKTKVHLSSCNTDYSCLKGDCPSFVTIDVKPGTTLARRKPPPLEGTDLPEPTEKATMGDGYNIYMPGIGGTGVITTSSLLCYAAWMEGKQVRNLDQTGLAQKGGPVTASLILTEESGAHVNKVGFGKTDLYLVHDLLGGVNQKNVSRLDSQRTVAIVNTTSIPTGEMARHPDRTFPGLEELKTEVSQLVRRQDSVFLDAGRLAEDLFGDHLMTNILTLGAAYQSGRIPLRAESIEVAIRLNGVAVDENIQAFRYGRLWLVDQQRVENLISPRGTPTADGTAPDAGFSRRQRAAYDGLMSQLDVLDPEARRLLAIRLGELTRYQNARYARRYLEIVLRVADRDTFSHELTHAVIRYLYKLMAYKDEYEVARLLLKTSVQRDLLASFEAPKRVYFNIQPPFLRALGLKRKLRLGAWSKPILWLLTTLRHLRGTPIDMFGYTKVRRNERSLITWYVGLIVELSQMATAENYEDVVAIAEMPDAIRGFEQIKLNNAATTLAEVDDRMRRLRGEDEVVTGR